MRRLKAAYQFYDDIYLGIVYYFIGIRGKYFFINFDAAIRGNILICYPFHDYLTAGAGANLRIIFINYPDRRSAYRPKTNEPYFDIFLHNCSFKKQLCN